MVSISETRPFIKLLLENSAIIGEIDKRIGVFTGIHKLKKKEQHTNIKISGFILENLSTRKLFLTQSHPAGPVLIHCVNQILNGLGYSELHPYRHVLFNEAKYQDPLPLSPYELAHYGFEYAHEPDSHWKQFYSNEIEKFIKSLNYRK